MSEMPDWWIWISGLFFLANVVFFLAMAYVMLFVVRPMLQGLSPKLQAISAKVESISERVDELATTTRTSVEALSGRAQSVATSVDSIMHVASKQFERFSPFLVGALTAIKLVKAVSEVRQGKSVAKATSKRELDERNDGKSEAKEGKKKLDKRARA